jgi:spore photoproduct lyase
MKFELDGVFVEEACRTSPLVKRVLNRLPSDVPVHQVSDGRKAARPLDHASDPFGAGKRRLVLMNRRGEFLMGCPAASREFACCGYLVMILASNCPMDCSYCFLQEYVAENPGLQIFANYANVFDELDRLGRTSRDRTLRIGTGELADSLAFDYLTEISTDLVDYFSRRQNLILELKTKTDDIGSLLKIDPRERTIVSWTLSPERVFRSSEHRTASPSARIAAARRVFDHGYKIAIHLDPIIAYPEGEADYHDLLTELFDSIPAEHISFVSLGGLRMTPGLRSRARRRFPFDPMLLQEEVLAPDRRYRTFAPLRLKLYAKLQNQIRKASPRMPVYLCMETSNTHRRVFGTAPPTSANLGEQLVAGR